MTRQGLADAAGVDLKTIYNLESGTRWPIAKTRAAVADALGWPPDALSVLAEDFAPGALRPTGIRIIDEAATAEQLAPFVWQVEREVEDAERKYGPAATGEQVFGAGGDADAWNSPSFDRNAKMRLIATFRMFAFQNRGGQSGEKTGLMLVAPAPAAYS